MAARSSRRSASTSRATRWSAGPDGLDVIRDLVPAAADVLVRGGRLAVEVGQGQSRAVEALFERSGFSQVEAIRDLAGIPRVVTGRAR